MENQLIVTTRQKRQKIVRKYKVHNIPYNHSQSFIWRNTNFSPNYKRPVRINVLWIVQTNIANAKETSVCLLQFRDYTTEPTLMNFGVEINGAYEKNMGYFVTKIKKGMKVCMKKLILLTNFHPLFYFWSKASENSYLQPARTRIYLFRRSREVLLVLHNSAVQRKRLYIFRKYCDIQKRSYEPSYS